VVVVLLLLLLLLLLLIVTIIVTIIAMLTVELEGECDQLAMPARRRNKCAYQHVT
jgi:hypothetical protein